MSERTAEQVVDDWRMSLADHDPYEEIGILVRAYEDAKERLGAITKRANAAESDWREIADFVLSLKRGDCWCDNGPLGHTPACQEAQRVTVQNTTPDPAHEHRCTVATEHSPDMECVCSCGARRSRGVDWHMPEPAVEVVDLTDRMADLGLAKGE